MKQSDVPYMWAESSQYIYRGRVVAKLKGSLYDAPEIILAEDADGNVIEPEPNGAYLRSIDIPLMIERNRELMEIIESSTVKRYWLYMKNISVSWIFFMLLFLAEKIAKCYWI